MGMFAFTFRDIKRRTSDKARLLKFHHMLKIRGGSKVIQRSSLWGASAYETPNLYKTVINFDVAPVRLKKCSSRK